MCAAPAGNRAGVSPSASARADPVPACCRCTWLEAVCCWGMAETPGTSRTIWDRPGRAPLQLRLVQKDRHRDVGSGSLIPWPAAGKPLSKMPPGAGRRLLCSHLSLGCPSTAPGDAREMPNAHSSPGRRQPRRLCGGASSRPGRSLQPPCLPRLELLPHLGRRFLQRAMGQQPLAPRGAARQRQESPQARGLLHPTVHSLSSQQPLGACTA